METTKTSGASETVSGKYADDHGGGAGKFLFVKRLSLGGDPDQVSGGSLADRVLTLADLEWAIERLARRAVLPLLPNDAALDAIAAGLNPGSSDSTIGMSVPRSRYCAWPFFDRLGTGGVAPNWLNDGSGRGTTPDALANGWGSAGRSLAGTAGFVGFSRGSSCVMPDGGVCVPVSYEDLADAVRDSLSGALAGSLAGAMCARRITGRVGYVTGVYPGVASSVGRLVYKAESPPGTTPDSYDWEIAHVPLRIYGDRPPLAPLNAPECCIYSGFDSLSEVRVEFPGGVARTAKVPPAVRTLKATAVSCDATGSPRTPNEVVSAADAGSASVAVYLRSSLSDWVWPSLYSSLGIGAAGVGVPYGGTRAARLDVVLGEPADRGRHVVLSGLVPGGFPWASYTGHLSYGSGGVQLRVVAPCSCVGWDGVVRDPQSPWGSRDRWLGFFRGSDSEFGGEDLFGALAESDRALCRDLCVPPGLPGDLPYYLLWKPPDYAAVPASDGWLAAGSNKDNFVLCHRCPAVLFAAWVRGLDRAMGLFSRTVFKVERVRVDASLESRCTVSYSDGSGPRRYDFDVSSDYVMDPATGAGWGLRVGKGSFNSNPVNPFFAAYSGRVLSDALVSDSVTESDTQIGGVLRFYTSVSAGASVKVNSVSVVPSAESVRGRVTRSRSGNGWDETGERSFGEAPRPEALFSRRVAQFVSKVELYGVFSAAGRMSVTDIDETSVKGLGESSPTVTGDPRRVRVVGGGTCMEVRKICDMTVDSGGCVTATDVAFDICSVSSALFDSVFADDADMAAVSFDFDGIGSPGYACTRVKSATSGSGDDKTVTVVTKSTEARNLLWNVSLSSLFLVVTWDFDKRLS